MNIEDVCGGETRVQETLKVEWFWIEKVTYRTEHISTLHIVRGTNFFSLVLKMIFSLDPPKRRKCRKALPYLKLVFLRDELRTTRIGFF